MFLKIHKLRQYFSRYEAKLQWECDINLMNEKMSICCVLGSTALHPAVHHNYN